MTHDDRPDPQTALDERPRGAAARLELVMCAPSHFDVLYAINPWMAGGERVDRPRAVRQWEALAAVYRDLGHDVHRLDPVAGLPDMVFAANSAVVVDGRALISRFRHPERAGEVPPMLRWLVGHGVTVARTAAFACEGEGDVAVVGSTVLAAHGFRTDRRAHQEVADTFGRPTVSLGLVDPRFYHLDTALFALGDDNVAYYPGAFDAESGAALRELFPDAVLASEEDALGFGLNSVSDGRHVVMDADAPRLAAAVRERGYEVVAVQLTELHKSGGGAKCCTQEVRR